MSGIGSVRASALGLILMLSANPVRGEDRAAAPDGVIDATTMQRKVLCGYQGWFRCPGDAAGGGWRHWSRDGAKITPETVTFEMWPDVSELGDEEKYRAGDFTQGDRSPSVLFSSVHARTVERHFEWMREYGIDGVFLQRFLVELRDPSTDLVLSHARAAAAKTGRVWAVCYDLSGARPDGIVERLSRDWKRLVDELKVTEDATYLHHDGRPVVFVWGFFSDRFNADIAHRVIDLFEPGTPCAATLVGGCPWYWRQEQDAEWARALRRFDVISPWNVGNVSIENGQTFAATGTWKEDLAEAKRSGMDYLPVIYPGFGWTNLKGRGSEQATVPRLGGEVFWRQFVTARELGIEMAYVAMFDEVDEATAIFKVSNSPPVQGRFATNEGLPSDWYLRLTGEGTKLIRGERAVTRELPVRP